MGLRGQHAARGLCPASRALCPCLRAAHVRVCPARWRTPAPLCLSVGPPVQGHFRNLARRALSSWHLESPGPMESGVLPRVSLNLGVHRGMGQDIFHPGCPGPLPTQSLETRTDARSPVSCQESGPPRGSAGRRPRLPREAEGVGRLRSLGSLESPSPHWGGPGGPPLASVSLTPSLQSREQRLPEASFRGKFWVLFSMFSQSKPTTISEPLSSSGHSLFLRGRGGGRGSQ